METLVTLTLILKVTTCDVEYTQVWTVVCYTFFIVTYVLETKQKYGREEERDSTVVGVGNITSEQKMRTREEEEEPLVLTPEQVNSKEVIL